MVNASVTTSHEIDWPVGVLPWDRFTLPVISPNGLHAAVQLGRIPPKNIIVGHSNKQFDSTIISLHPLDPSHGMTMPPLTIEARGLLLSRAADDIGVFVESPRAEAGRWIGRINWETGKLSWIVANEAINAFPTVNRNGDIAWSQRDAEDDRFHLVVQTNNGKQIIDDGESDWLYPMLLGRDRLRAYRLKKGELRLVEFDLHTATPLLTAISHLIMEEGATRHHVWQIATTNPHASGSSQHAFYHPIRRCMTVWDPSGAVKTAYFLTNSLAAAPTSDGSWIVSLGNRVIRQEPGKVDGIHIRNQLAIPFATTSKQWTHYMLIPDGTRLQVRAVNLSN